MDLLRSLPLGLYLEQPITWLHRLDPRVKLLWLMGFLLTPLLGNPYWRLSLVGLLMAITLLAMIPLRVWRQQLGWLLTLCVLLFGLTAIAPDGLLLDHQTRRPALELTMSDSPVGSDPHAWQSSLLTWLGFSATVGAPLPPATKYQYVLFRQGPFLVTRRSLDLAVRISTLIFTLIYSTNLYLLTTAPEEIASALEDVMAPLRRLGVPVTEIALTLTLSLRYIPLVLEETQNLISSVWTRAINWKKLGLRRSAQVWLIVAERLLENLLLRAAQAASAMQVRGFTSPNQHRVQWHDLRLQRWDWVAMVALVILCGVRLAVGGQS
jgi:energy-coupling factor transport system permease protein